MNAQIKRYRAKIAVLPLLLLMATHGLAQAPADRYEGSPSASGEGIPVLTQAELVELVGPIALYPDDLLAIVLPASTYPLQLVEAARFLDDLEEDPSLEPDENWDDSVVALTNYPEVIELLNEDLDWTWQLGEAVVAQQADVIQAVESFRDRAYAAGNLRSDEHQNVTESDGVIEIAPVEEDVIYVPYYEPARVVVYQARPVYYYYPQAYPVYYYPYPYGHTFHHGFFWGVTTAFTIGWLTDSVHVYHHSYHSHPYYGYHYYDRWWYRSPSIHIHNSTYVYNSYSPSRHVDHGGDYWHPPGHRRRLSRSNQRITQSRYYTNRSDRRNDADIPGRQGHDRTGNNESRADTRRRNPPATRRDGQGRDRQGSDTRERNTRDRNDSISTDTRRNTRTERRDTRQSDVTIARRNDTTRRSGSYTPPQRQGGASSTTVRRPSGSGAATQPVRRAPQSSSHQTRNSRADAAPRRQPQQSQASTAPRTERRASEQGKARSESRSDSGRGRDRKH